MNTKSNRLLAFFLALLMIFPSLGESAYAVSLAFPKQAKEEIRGELKGKVEGSQKVFTIDKEKVEEVVENTQSEKVQARQKLKRSRRSLRGDRVSSEQKYSAQSTEQFRSPSGQEANTIVNLETKGLNNGNFDWKVFNESQFNVILGYTDDSNHFNEVGKLTFAEGQAQIKTNTNWPSYTAQVNAFQLKTDFNGNYDVRAYNERSSSNPNSGVLEFTLKVYELPNTNLKVQYQDIYGKALTENLPEDTDQAPTIKLNLGDGVEFDLPKADREINLRDVKTFEGIYGENLAGDLADAITTDNLNAVEKLNFTIDDKTSGDYTFGSGDSAKKYKYKIENKNTGMNGQLHDLQPIVTMTYQADVAVPPMKDDDQTQPVDTPIGYVRLTFIADEKSPGTNKGRFDDVGTKIKYIDVKEGLAYNNKKLQGIISGFSPVALGANGPSDTLVFDDWDPKVPNEATSTVSKQTYNAKYTNKYTKDDIIPYLPTENEPKKGSDNKDIPKNFIDVVFKSEDINKGKVKVGTKEGAEVKAKVRPNTDISRSSEISAVPSTNYGFTVWSPELTTITKDSVKEFTAKFVKSGDKIKKDDPIPNGWLKVTVKQDDTSIQANTVAESVYTLAPNDKLTTQGAFPNLTGKEKEGYKNPAWYKDNNTTSTPNPSAVAITANTTFTAKAEKETDADKYGSQLKAKDIAVWVGDTVDWTKGVETIQGVTFKNVEDATTPARTTATAGAFKGSLTVTFQDNTTATVANQKLFVREKKGAPVTPSTDDPGTTYPTDTVTVTFAKGDGITSLTPENKVLKMKSGEELKAEDYPTVAVNTTGGYKTKTKNTDYYDVQPGAVTATKTITASATQDNVPSVIYNPVEVIKGDSKTVTPSVNNIPNGSKYSIPDNFQVPNGIEIRINEDDGSVTIVTREDTPNQTFDVPVEVKDSNGSLITNSRVNIFIVDKEIPENNDKEIGGWFKIIDGYKTEGNNNRKDEIGYAKAYIFGYPNKTVRPDNNLTRAEGVSMVARLQGYDLSDKSKPVFADTKADWYAGALNAAYKAGILEEKPGQNFRPNENMTRAELAQLISHIDKKNDAIAPFVDIKGHKFEAAINQCYGNKRILGYPDGTFKPDAYITRGEAATILNNFYNRKVRAEGLKNVVVTDFIDIVPSHWAYYEIIEASHNHEYRRLRENDIEELWLRIDR